MKEFFRRTFIEIVNRDWKRITLQSYTAWAFYALIAVTMAPDILYAGFEIDTNPLVWGWLQLLIAIFGVVGRLIIQDHKTRIVRRLCIAAIVVTALALALPVLAAAPDDRDSVAFTLISKWEGKKNHSYQDMVGVWTICYGHTATAGPGQWRSDDDCRDLLIEEIALYRDALHRYFSEKTKRSRLTVRRDAAYTSLAYNVGARAAGKSTATRRLNRGDIAGGCRAIGWWNKSGGRTVRGLVLRRSEEYEYCMAGVPAW